MLPEITRFERMAWAGEAARHVAQRILSAIDEHGVCRLALAGGTTPRPVYEVLAQLPVPWGKVSLFWGDERCVPKDDPESNFAMAKTALIDRVVEPVAGIHRIETERPAGEAALAYERLLGLEPMHVVLLGMGGDGHVASLFPGNAITSSLRRAIPAISPRAPRERVSMSLFAINESFDVLMLVTGRGKARIVRDVYDQIRSGEPRLPAARVQPERSLSWILDTDAGSQLEITE